MAAAGTFTLTELGRVGRQIGARPDGAEGEVFEWTSDRNPQSATKGGARAIPKRPWTQGGELRTVRTDYPGAKTPSEQVLGPNHKDQHFVGRWDDRYNFAGYARSEMLRFEDMARRGNMVRISFQERSFLAILKDWNFDYQRSWQIGYSFTASIHDRHDATNVNRSPDTTRSATEAFDQMVDIMAVLINGGVQDLRTNALESKLNTPAVDASKAALASMAVQRDALGDSLDQQELNIPEGPNQTITPFRRYASKFRGIQKTAFGLIDSLIDVRSDLEMDVRTVMGVLDYENWSRSLRFQCHVLTGNASAGAREMDERDQPDAVRVYRPHQGESLYKISRRFYGTPDAWRLIADRNGLTDFVLTGEELLIIPERGAG